MSQRGRSGFLSYLLLLSRLLQFEHRAEEEGQPRPQGQPGTAWVRRGGEARTWGPRGWGSLASTMAVSPPAQLEQLARRAQRPAATVLCLHGAQSNLSALQLAVL